MLDKIINVPLIMQPLNWGIILAFLMISGFAFTLIVEASRGAACDCNS